METEENKKIKEIRKQQNDKRIRKREGSGEEKKEKRKEIRFAGGI